MKLNDIKFLIIGIVLIVVSIIISITNSNPVDKINNKYTDLAKVSNENKNVYLYVDYVLSSKDNYYIVDLNDNLYVVKSNDNLKKYTFDGKYTRVVGETKRFTEEQKVMITELYENSYEESEEQETDFDSTFGNYYIEAEKVVDDTSMGSVSNSFASLLLDCGIVLIVVYILGIIIDRKKQI